MLLLYYFPPENHNFQVKAMSWVHSHVMNKHEYHESTLMSLMTRLNIGIRVDIDVTGWHWCHGLTLMSWADINVTGWWWDQQRIWKIKHNYVSGHQYSMDFLLLWNI